MGEGTLRDNSRGRMQHTLHGSLHSLDQVVIMYSERGGKVIGGAQRQDSQAGLLGGVLVHKLIDNLIYGAVATRSNQNVIVCRAQQPCYWGEVTD